MMKLILTLILFLIPFSVRADIVVSSTIRPIYFIASAISKDVAISKLIITKKEIHEYALRPKEVKLIGESDLIIAVDINNFEILLKNSILKSKATLINISDLEGVMLMEGQGKTDYHLWLDIDNARVIASSIAENLMLLVPDKKATIEQNLREFLDGIRKLDNRIQKKLSPVKSVGFLTTHDGYGYLIAKYNLNFLGALEGQHSQKKGFKDYLEVVHLIEEKKPQCLFTEKYHESPFAEKLILHTGIATAKLDPEVGRENEEVGQDYFYLLQDIVDNMASCLGASSKT